MQKHRTNRVGAAISFVVAGLFILISSFVFLNRQFVMDQLAVWAYTPSSEIESIESKTAMTNRGQFVFYATHPEVATAERFNELCPRQETQSPILGCYTSEDRIYIYNVADERLNGIEEVTAAHEMLHAVWHRMDSAEQKRLGQQLEAVYAKSTDEAFKNRMSYYQRNEPGEFQNELYAILGTEQAKLTPELERHYAQYFTDRQKVVALYEQYNTVYVGILAQLETLATQMTTLGKSIDDKSASYTARSSSFSAQVDAFNARATSGQFSSTSQFMNERAILMNTSRQLDAERDSINGDITLYGTYYAQYQELAKELDVLNKSIDSYELLEAGSAL